ncbi:hypothetical protein AGMMS50268_00870 [Spirochaetia bacterium]|nr:hypothetical protein AGMMS50268_00870 [Spirochaetia bacterium]
MGVFDRLGDVIKSYLNDEDEKIFGRSSRGHQRGGDPDLDAAFDELNDFLGGDSAGSGHREGGTRRDSWRGIVDEEPEGRYRRQDEAGGGAGNGNAGRTGSAGNSGGAGGTRGAGSAKGGAYGTAAGQGTPPDALRQDFAELGLSPQASAEECKAAYKRLLKIHHPDRHAGHAGNMKKATEKSARINAAYDRIVRWRETGKS